MRPESEEFGSRKMEMSGGDNLSGQDFICLMVPSKHLTPGYSQEYGVGPRQKKVR